MTTVDRRFHHKWATRRKEGLAIGWLAVPGKCSKLSPESSEAVIRQAISGQSSGHRRYLTEPTPQAGPLRYILSLLFLYRVESGFS